MSAADQQRFVLDPYPVDRCTGWRLAALMFLVSLAMAIGIARHGANVDEARREPSAVACREVRPLVDGVPYRVCVSTAPGLDREALLPPPSQHEVRHTADGATWWRSSPAIGNVTVQRDR